MNAKTPDHLLDNATPKTANGKMLNAIYGCLSPAVPADWYCCALTAYAVAPKKLRALAWVGPALVHGVIPALDRIIGEDKSNPPESAIKDLENDKYYGRVVKAFMPLPNMP
jgi:alkane 1-monooxygenase